jgi:DNA-binding transcriptional LysR family regulator
MIAVPVSGDVLLTVVGAPSYFARRPKPAHPRDLVTHECIAWHPAPGAPAYRWEFTEAGREFSVATPTRVLTTDGALLVRLARAGVGLAMVFEGRVRESIARGARREGCTHARARAAGRVAARVLGHVQGLADEARQAAGAEAQGRGGARQHRHRRGH